MTAAGRRAVPGWQVIEVALEVPLAPFAFGRSGQGNDPGEAGIEELGDSLDRPALAGGIAAFEDDHDALFCGVPTTAARGSLRRHGARVGRAPEGCVTGRETQLVVAPSRLHR
jgi:hypothetical protein